jgi:hypothetical protein
MAWRDIEFVIWCAMLSVEITDFALDWWAPENPGRLWDLAAHVISLVLFRHSALVRC